MMSVKASVSISEQQEAFARGLVAEGRYPSVSAVVQRGLDILQSETERQAAEINALRGFFEDRRAGPFESDEDARIATREMIARKRADRGL